MTEKLTVAVDGEPASDAAVAWVIDRATHVDLSLEITAVIALNVELPQGAVSRTPYEHAVAQARASVILVHPDLPLVTNLRHGIVHDEIVAASRRSDLLVIGSNRPSALAGMINGTLPLRVAGWAGCTTIVVPAGWRASTGRIVAGWTDDETSDRALDFAAREAVRRKVGLTIVHAWSAPPSGSLVPSTPPSIVQDLATAHRGLLAEAVDRITREFPELQVSHSLSSGSASAAIIRAAAGASLVVIGSRGRGVIASLILGSVSHDVLMTMPTVVAVIPREDHHHEPH
ncbi:nucleotide-binding universal stress UspA family protein [Salinibacterium sp. CAN_S4]|uniref:universal stress protein n=1 Tax=Salinibacterium sp. CAN_S4 TaxID=2787727 RepID=UPI0018EF96FA